MRLGNNSYARVGGGVSGELPAERGIGIAVVHDQEFEIAEGLGEDRIDGFVQQFGRGLPYRHKHGDCGARTRACRVETRLDTSSRRSRDETRHGTLACVRYPAAL